MIRVLIVDDQKLMRESIRAILARDKDIHVVGEARDGEEALELTCELQPDVIVMDIRMPVLDGLQATRQICGQASHAHVLIFAGTYEEDMVRQSLEGGAKGYLVKHEGLFELASAVRALHSGETYYSASVSRFLSPSVN